MSVNPYRYRLETTKGSQHLLHALLATASHFKLRSPSQSLPPQESLDHKNTSMTLYLEASTKTASYSNGLILLDTLLALWQLEVRLLSNVYEEIELILLHEQGAVSALNIWRAHITDAYNLLELSGSIRRWTVSMRATVQVSMILW